VRRPEPCEVTDVDATTAEVRREAAPAAVVLLAVFVALALLSRMEGWALLGFPWWAWLILGVPALFLVIDLLVARRGRGLVRSRQAAIALLFFLVAGNIAALGVLVVGLMTTNTSDLGGGELLATGLAIYVADLIVFGLMFWELDAGGPFVRSASSRRRADDLRFPQDESDASGGWRPQVWDYLYVSLTNAIAFSPTDTMPLSLRAKAAMGIEAAISAATVLLVAARAVNVLGS
jgi:hypothetical protein